MQSTLLLICLYLLFYLFLFIYFWRIRHIKTKTTDLDLRLFRQRLIKNIRFLLQRSVIICIQSVFAYTNVGCALTVIFHIFKESQMHPCIQSEISRNILDQLVTLNIYNPTFQKQNRLNVFTQVLYKFH